MNNVVIGSGLIASSVVKKLESQNLVHLAKLNIKNEIDGIFYLQSSWRQNAIMYSTEKGGLSNHYHGVMPAEIIKEFELISNKCGYTFPKIDKIENIEKYSYVPFFPRRPAIKKLERKIINSFSDVRDSKIYLCSGVVGNIRILMKEGFIEEEQVIGDHLVVALGTVDYDEIINNLKAPFSVITTKGCFFRHYDLNELNARIFFRPDFNKYSNINFADTVEGINKFLIKGDFYSKIKSGIFNKTSFPRMKGRYRLYAQIAVDDLYIVGLNSICEKKDISIYAHTLIRRVQDILSTEFCTYKFTNVKSNDIIPGIHLYYDRDLIKSIPEDIEVFDTSLCPDKKFHPTVWSSIMAYKLA